VLRIFGRARHRMLSALIVVGLLVPAMPMAAMADLPEFEFDASLTANPETVTVVAGELLAEAPDEAPLEESNLAIRLQNDEGWTWWGEVVVEIDAETEAHVQAWFEDSGDWHNVVSDGWSTGVFEIAEGYDEATRFYVLGDTPGTYTVTMSLYMRDEFDGLVDTATVTVVVQEEPKPEPEPEEEPEEEIVPVLPTTGLGPDRSVPWQAVILVSLALGLAYSTRRRNAVSSE